MLNKRKISPAVTALFIIYCLILLRLTVFRDGFSFDTSALFKNGSVVFMPASTYVMMYKNGAYGLVAYNLLGNIIMFIPLGFYAKYASPKMKIQTLFFMGIACSFCIELAQFALGTGVSDIDDIILNTLGVILGGAFCGNKSAKRRKKR